MLNFHVEQRDIVEPRLSVKVKEENYLQQKELLKLKLPSVHKKLTFRASGSFKGDQLWRNDNAVDVQFLYDTNPTTHCIFFQK